MFVVLLAKHEGRLLQTLNKESGQSIGQIFGC